MDERHIIDTIFKPLAAGTAPALGLENDTAIYSPPKNCDLVVTKDVMIEGVHFLQGENPSVIANRLLRANLSDLAASGATPVGYLLGLMGPKKIVDSWLQGFAAALNEDQKEFDITLMGGDTTSGSKSLCLSLTALGTVKKGTALTRQGARPRDLLCVSGTIGDAHLGLKSLKGEMPKDDYLIKRFQKPQPRLLLGQSLIGMASATIDVSDGLVVDVENLARASGVGVRVDLNRVPLSAPAKNYVAGDQTKLIDLITAGEDFELLFTLPRGHEDQIKKLVQTTGLSVTVIGEITESTKCEFFDTEGQKVSLIKKGYSHFTERG